MTVLFLVLPLALLASAVALVGFVWSVSRGQLDDLVTPAMRMLVDDEARRDASARASSEGTSSDSESRGGASERGPAPSERAPGATTDTSSG